MIGTQNLKGIIETLYMKYNLKFRKKNQMTSKICLFVYFSIINLNFF